MENRSGTSKQAPGTYAGAVHLRQWQEGQSALRSQSSQSGTTEECYDDGVRDAVVVAVGPDKFTGHVEPRKDHVSRHV